MRTFAILGAVAATAGLGAVIYGLWELPVTWDK